jgi:hypothetical protein
MSPAMAPRANEHAVDYGPLMKLEELRTKIERRVDVVRARANRRVWDLLGALQVRRTSFESSFVLWTSPVTASHLKSHSPLKPYLCQLRQTTLVEPRTVFAIADYGLLIETSVSNAYAARDPVLKRVFYLPSPGEYFKARFLRRYRTDLKQVIALGTAWPFNYFHFYRDFLPKILLLEDAHIDPAIPVVVPDELIDQPFFREAIQSERLSRWNFVSPRGQFIKSESIVFCSAQQFILMDRSKSPESELLDRCSEGVMFLENPDGVLALLNLDRHLPSAVADRRVFLTRGANRGRTLYNYQEIEPLLSERNFETVDTEGMSLVAQAQLFRQCRYVIGVHGAGLTNIIYAHGHDLSLLQLRQPGEEHLVTDFALMCHAFGFDHREIFGTSVESGGGWRWSRRVNRNGAFYIDPSVLRTAIDEMMASSPSDS